MIQKPGLLYFEAEIRQAEIAVSERVMFAKRPHLGKPQSSPPNHWGNSPHPYKLLERQLLSTATEEFFTVVLL